MNKLILAAMAVGTMAQCGAIDLAKEDWKVPNWGTVVSAPGAAAKTPNLVVHEKDTFKVVAKYRYGRNNGIEVVPGGKDGAVRFAWCFTPNWLHSRQTPTLPVYGVVQFGELKDGTFSDITLYGGFNKYIKR